MLTRTAVYLVHILKTHTDVAVVIVIVVVKAAHVPICSNQDNSTYMVPGTTTISYELRRVGLPTYRYVQQ